MTQKDVLLRTIICIGIIVVGIVLHHNALDRTFVELQNPVRGSDCTPDHNPAGRMVGIIVQDGAQRDFVWPKGTRLTGRCNTAGVIEWARAFAPDGKSEKVAFRSVFRSGKVMSLGDTVGLELK